jgi:hypothetical protein
VKGWISFKEERGWNCLRGKDTSIHEICTDQSQAKATEKSTNMVLLKDMKKSFAQRNNLFNLYAK